MSCWVLALLHSLKNGACLFHVLLVGDVSLPVRSHEVHCLLSLEAVEHVLTHQGILSVSVHLISKSQFLLLADLSLHVVVLNLAKQGGASVIHINVTVHVLVLRSRCVLNWEWIEVSGTCGVNVWMELISIATSAATILHLDEVQRTANWSMHILELPLSIFLFTLCDLLLPNLSIIVLSVFLGLGPHLEVLSVVFDLGVKLRFFDVSLILELVYLIEEALFSSTKG